MRVYDIKDFYCSNLFRSDFWVSIHHHSVNVYFSWFWDWLALRVEICHGCMNKNLFSNYSIGPYFNKPSLFNSIHCANLAVSSRNKRMTNFINVYLNCAWYLFIYLFIFLFEPKLYCSGIVAMLLAIWNSMNGTKVKVKLLKINKSINFVTFH